MIEHLRRELEELRATIATAEKADSQVQGGLIKALIATRLEILRTTETLVKQRIHAIEGGAPVAIQLPVTEPNLSRAAELQEEISNAERELSLLRADAERYTGGLVQSLKLTTLATKEQTIALLQQGMLTAKYGLPYALPKVGANGLDGATRESSPPTTGSKKQLIAVTLLQKHLTHEGVLVLDLDFVNVGLDKPTRAVKGFLVLSDLFGESRLRINWTIDQALALHGSVRTLGMGFHFNQFMENHQWVERTPVADIVVSFEAAHILFQDGSRQDL